MALVLEIRTTSKKAAAEIKKLATKAGASVKTLEKKSTSASSKMTKGFKDFQRMLGGLGLGLGFVVAIKGFNRIVAAASDTEESLNKVREVFGDAALSVEKFAETAAESLGASEQAALAMTGEIGNLLVAMKFSEDAAADFSTDMVQLAADLGSFNNVPTADALNAIRSALVGESEPIRRFGADVRQTRLDQIALGMGLEFTKGKMDAQTKALAAMEAIMQDTRKAHGDFRRTSDGLANSQKILTANIDDLKAAIGERLMPVMKGAVDVLTGFLEQFTSTELEGAIKSLSKLGADTQLLKRLKTQSDIISLLGDEVKVKEQLANLEIKSTEQLKETGKVLGFLRKVEHFEINKILRERVQLLIDEAVATKKTESIIKEAEAIAKQRLAIQTEITNLIAKGKIIEDEQIIALNLQKGSLDKIFTGLSETLNLLTQQEAIEQSIKNLKSGQLDVVNKIVVAQSDGVNEAIKLDLKLRQIFFTWEDIIQKQKDAEFHAKLIADATERWKREAEEAKQQLFEAAGILNEIVSLATGARKFGISGILGIGAGIATLFGAAPLAAGLQAGAIATRGFQGGGSFTVPGTGGGDRPHLVNLAPGEQVDITPRNQVNNNQKINLNFTFMTADEITIKTKVIPIINDFVSRQGGKLLASGLA